MRALALRRAMSSQIGWPGRGQGRVRQGQARGPRRPPGRWPPCRGNGSRPPGDAHTRQPSSAASSRLSSPRAKRAPIDWILPVSSPSVGGSVTPPGTSTQGKLPKAGQGHHHGRQALVAGGHAEHAAGVGDRADQPAEDAGRVVAVGQAVEHAGRALGAAVARVGAVGGIGHGPGLARTPRPPPRSPAPAPSARCDSPGRWAGRRRPRRPPSVLSITNCGPASADGLPAHAGVFASCRRRRRWAGRGASRRSAAACPAGRGAGSDFVERGVV